MLNWVLSVLLGVWTAAARPLGQRAIRLSAGFDRATRHWDAVLRRMIPARLLDPRRQAMGLIPVVANPNARQTARRRLARRADDPPTLPPARGRYRGT